MEFASSLSRIAESAPAPHITTLMNVMSIASVACTVNLSCLQNFLYPAVHTYSLNIIHEQLDYCTDVTCHVEHRRACVVLSTYASFNANAAYSEVI